MNTTNQLIEQYIAIWNETDDIVRHALIQRTFTPDATYVDPMLESESHTGIDAMIKAVQSQFPNHQFHALGEPQLVQNRIRFSWQATNPNGEVFIAGTDFASITEDNRFASITGFLDVIPQGA